MQQLIEKADFTDDQNETEQSLVNQLQPHYKSGSLIFEINPEENKFDDSHENNELRGNFANIVDYINTSLIECASQQNARARKRKIEELFHMIIVPVPPIIITDLSIQGMSDIGEEIYYYECLSWYYAQNHLIAGEIKQKTKSLKTSASFSMLFTLLFYSQVLKQNDRKNDSLKSKLYLAKGVAKLLEEDVKHDHKLFLPVFNSIKEYILEGDDFIEDSKLSIMIFEEYLYLLTRFYIFYMPDNTNVSQKLDDQINLKSASIHQVPLSKMMTLKNLKIHESNDGLKDFVFRLADVYLLHIEKCLSEEEKAEKLIEHSYIMLHIYWADQQNGKSDQQSNPQQFEARIIITDLIFSDTLKLMKQMTQHDALYNIMQKLTQARELPYMSKVTENRLMNGLTDFSHPGGPYFPSRPVRQLAIKVMNSIFPVSPNVKRARKIVHSFFRMLHPYYWTESVAYHSFKYVERTCSKIKQTIKQSLLYCWRKGQNQLIEEENTLIKEE